MILRDGCYDCAKKHISQAYILYFEALQGYPAHRYLAIGHIAEAAEEIAEYSLDIATKLRELRKRIEAEEEADFPVLYLLDEIEKLEAGELIGETPGDAEAREMLDARTVGRITPLWDAASDEVLKNLEGNTASSDEEQERAALGSEADEQKCLICKFWIGNLFSNNECHYRAPYPQLEPVKQGQELEAHANWPTTDRRCFCSDWQSKPKGGAG